MYYKNNKFKNMLISRNSQFQENEETADATTYVNSVLKMILHIGFPKLLF